MNYQVDVNDWMLRPLLRGEPCSITFEDGTEIRLQPSFPRGALLREFGTLLSSPERLLLGLLEDGRFTNMTVDREEAKRRALQKAAPDLLEACKLAADCIGDEAILRVLRGAIEKAGGEDAKS